MSAYNNNSNSNSSSIYNTADKGASSNSGVPQTGEFGQGNTTSGFDPTSSPNPNFGNQGDTSGFDNPSSAAAPTGNFDTNTSTDGYGQDGITRSDPNLGGGFGNQSSGFDNSTSNSDQGTGARSGHNTGDNGTSGDNGSGSDNSSGNTDFSSQTSNAKPSFGDKLKGTAEEITGKVTRNPGLKERGFERKTGEANNY